MIVNDLHAICDVSIKSSGLIIDVFEDDITVSPVVIFDSVIL